MYNPEILPTFGTQDTVCRQTKQKAQNRKLKMNNTDPSPQPRVNQTQSCSYQIVTISIISRYSKILSITEY
jgi:hypothetical protein